MNDDRFRSEVQRVRDEAVSLAQAKLQGLMLKSVFVLSEALDGSDPVLRLRAVRAARAARAALKSEENRQIHHHLDVLDEAMSLLKGQM